MIPNVTRGGKTHGVLLYLVGKGKREEQRMPPRVLRRRRRPSPPQDDGEKRRARRGVNPRPTRAKAKAESRAGFDAAR